MFCLKDGCLSYYRIKCGLHRGLYIVSTKIVITVCLQNNYITFIILRSWFAELLILYLAFLPSFGFQISQRKEIKQNNYLTHWKNLPTKVLTFYLYTFINFLSMIFHKLISRRDHISSTGQSSFEVSLDGFLLGLVVRNGADSSSLV